MIDTIDTDSVLLVKARNGSVLLLQPLKYAAFPFQGTLFTIFVLNITCPPM